MSAILMMGQGQQAPEQVPYAFPTSAPYNAPEPCITPTDDGYGETIHPDVLDFGPSGWNGHRFWMASTAFHAAEPARENPHIHWSDDGFHWHVPAGLTNPVDPWPGAATGDTNWYNSDTDMAYDPDTGKLVLTWREFKNVNWEIIWASTSSDGATWSAPVEILRATQSRYATIVSQAIFRVGPGDWRMVTFDMNGDNVDRIWTSTGPLTTFATPTPLVYTSAPSGFDAYHGNVTYDSATGRFYMIVQWNGKEWAGASTDGINWKINTTNVLAGLAGKWDPSMYRSTMTLHENGTHVRVWYTAHGDTYGRHVGYTQIPRSFWDSLFA